MYPPVGLTHTHVSSSYVATCRVLTKVSVKLTCQPRVGLMREPPVGTQMCGIRQVFWEVDKRLRKVWHLYHRGVRRRSGEFILTNLRWGAFILTGQRIKNTLGQKYPYQSLTSLENYNIYSTLSLFMIPLMKIN